MAEKNELSTEQAILFAAEELFMEQGYARTSTTAIAKKAGCNQALVHYYYRSKDQLFSLVFKKKISLLLSFFHEVSQEDLPFEEKLKRKIGAHFDMIRANEKFPVLFFNEIATNLELAKKVLADFREIPLPAIRTLQAELDAEYQAGRIRKAFAPDVVFTLLSVNLMTFLSKPLVQMLASLDEESMNKMLDERRETNIRIVLNSLKPF